MILESYNKFLLMFNIKSPNLLSYYDIHSKM
jgi:hypothetical protein